MARVTNQMIEDLRLPPEIPGLGDSRGGYVDPRALQALAWNTDYDVDARQREIDAARKKIAEALLAQQLAQQQPTSQGQVGGSVPYYPPSGGTGGGGTGGAPDGSTAAPSSSTGMSFMGMPVETTTTAPPGYQYNAPAKDQDTAPPAPPTNPLSQPDQPAQPAPQEQQAQPAPQENAPATPAPTAPAPAAPAGVPATNNAAGLFGPGYNSGVLEGSPQGVFEGAAVTAAPGLTGLSQGTMGPGFGMSVAGPTGPVAGYGMGMGRGDITGAPQGYNVDANAPTTSAFTSPAAQMAAAMAAHNAQNAPAPPSVTQQEAEQAEPGAKTNTSLSDLALSAIVEAMGNPVANQPGGLVVGPQAAQQAAQAEQAAANVAAVNAETAAAQQAAAAVQANQSAITAANLSGFNVAGPVVGTPVSMSAPPDAFNAPDQSPGGRSISAGMPAGLLAAGMYTTQAPAPPSTFLGDLLQSMPDLALEAPSDITDPSNNPAQNAITNALDTAAMNQNAPPSHSIHAPAPPSTITTAPDESSESESATDVAGALAAAIAAAMDTSTSVNDAVTGYNVDAATTTDNASAAFEGASSVSVAAANAAVDAAAAGITGALGAVANGASPSSAISDGAAAVAAAAADAAAAGITGAMGDSGSVAGGFGGESGTSGGFGGSAGLGGATGIGDAGGGPGDGGVSGGFGGDSGTSGGQGGSAGLGGATGIGDGAGVSGGFGGDSGTSGGQGGSAGLGGATGVGDAAGPGSDGGVGVGTGEGGTGEGGTGEGGTGDGASGGPSGEGGAGGNGLVMLNYVYGHDEVVARFVAQVSPNEALRERGFGKNTAMGVIDGEGKLIGGVVYHDWQPQTGTIMISAAGLPTQNWFTRDTLNQMFSYVFDRCKCQMAISAIPETKRFEGLLLLFAAIGYARARVARLYGRECDGIIATLTEEQWAESRFNRHGHKQQKEAA